MNKTLMETMLLGKYSDYFTVSNMGSGIFRQIAKSLCEGINFIVKPTDNFLSKIYKYVTGANFATNSQLFKFFKQFNFIIPVIFALCLIFLAWQMFSASEERKANVPKFVRNMMIAFAVVFVGSSVFIQLNKFTYQGIQFIDISESSQSYAKIVKANTFDLAYLCQNITSDKKIDSSALNKKNNLPLSICKNLDPTTVIESPEEIITQTKHPNLSDVQEVLTKRPLFNPETGEIEYNDLSKGFFGIGEEHYYRFKINYFMILVTQLCTAIVLVFTSFAVIRRVFEATCAFGTSYIVAFADLNDGKRLKKLLQFVLFSYLTILATAFCYKIYFFFLGLIPDDFNIFVKLVIMGGLTWIMVDGPTFIEKTLTGQDAGLGDGFKAASQVSQMMRMGREFGSAVRGVAGAAGAAKGAFDKLGGKGKPNDDGLEEDNKKMEKEMQEKANRNNDDNGINNDINQNQEINQDIDDDADDDLSGNVELDDIMDNEIEDNYGYLNNLENEMGKDFEDTMYSNGVNSDKDIEDYISAKEQKDDLHNFMNNQNSSNPYPSDKHFNNLENDIGKSIESSIDVSNVDKMIDKSMETSFDSNNIDADLDIDKFIDSYDKE